MPQNSISWNLTSSLECQLAYKAYEVIRAKVVAEYSGNTPADHKSGRPVKRDKQAILAAWAEYQTNCQANCVRPSIGKFCEQNRIPLRSFNEIRRQNQKIRGW
jgi:hypothetical protein